MEIMFSVQTLSFIACLLIYGHDTAEGQIQTFEGGTVGNDNSSNPNSTGQVNPAGILGPTNPLGRLLSEQIARGNIQDVDWSQIDRRSLDGWTHLYPFGEMFFDEDISGRPWNDRQIDLDFYFPFYGFRFNYTFIFPEGFIAFSFPHYIQPPYIYPNPRWPAERDSSFIAAFMTPQTVVAAGEHQISHLWYRVIHRPPNMVGQGIQGQGGANARLQNSRFTGGGYLNDEMPVRYYNGQRLWTQTGRIEDPEFLNTLTRDIREGMVGARGFTADYALLVTWERYAYGGSPKFTRLDLYSQTRSWQNTYQMVIASDEIRSYVMFNYGHINWTSSTSAGALSGRGGKQSALVGFNGGNGTGFVQLPYSAEENSYKLVQFGSTTTAGRWVARVDESIVYGGCTNDSIGVLRPDGPYATMLGGFALNVSGPCFKPGNVIKLQIDEQTIDCNMLNIVVARCVIPFDAIFRSGLTDIKLSVDGGKTYPFWSKFYILMPAMVNQVRLINDPGDSNNNWRNPDAANLTLQWSSVNITTTHNAQINIELWGYWEDLAGHRLVKVGTIGRGLPNSGRYTFDPRTLNRDDMTFDSWQWYLGGVVTVAVKDHNRVTDLGDGQYSSELIPFGWYFKDVWAHHYGKNWALEICQEWFEADGRREDFFQDLETKISCPCALRQALADFGRFTTLNDCDADGNDFCYPQGASHCVVSTSAAWNGAGQMCCYDPSGSLMFGDDYEYNAQYLSFYSAGVSYRAHPWGNEPYKRPPYVPSLSNFFHDLMPFEFCCKWAAHCEFYFWRRPTSSCQNYRPPKLAVAYGDPHFITYDGLRYSFQGKGYYVLSMMKSPNHDLMIQARMEQPPDHIFSNVSATVITGIAARDNGSSVVQVFARKTFRRWRYRTDIYVDGKRIFQDRSFKKLHTFPGVSILSPPGVMDMGTVVLMFTTGVGVKVTENRGMLSAIVSLPPAYNETLANPHGTQIGTGGANKCADYYRSLGLLGTWNDDADDDLTSPDCQETRVQQPIPTATNLETIYRQFGQKWKVDGSIHPLLFQSKHQPLYNPANFANQDFTPVFDINATMRYDSVFFSRNSVKVTCQGVPSCEYDYISTGRKEVALDTLAIEKSFKSLKSSGEQKYSPPPGRLRYLMSHKRCRNDSAVEIVSLDTADWSAVRCADVCFRRRCAQFNARASSAECHLFLDDNPSEIVDDQDCVYGRREIKDDKLRHTLVVDNRPDIPGPFADGQNVTITCDFGFGINEASQTCQNGTFPKNPSVCDSRPTSCLRYLMSHKRCRNDSAAEIVSLDTGDWSAVRCADVCFRRRCAQFNARASSAECHLFLDDNPSTIVDDQDCVYGRREIKDDKLCDTLVVNNGTNIPGPFADGQNVTITCDFGFGIDEASQTCQDGMFSMNPSVCVKL